MKKIIYAFLLPFLLVSCQYSADTSGGDQAAALKTDSLRNGVFIHLSKGPEDAHRVLMAFKMAEVMCSDNDVIMYLDIEAVHLVVEAAPDVSMEGFPSSHEQIRKLMDAGVTIQACPTCLKAAGYTEEDLLDGVVLANKEKFFTFTEGKILTIDY